MNQLTYPMKTIFQTLILACLASIFVDISACTREYSSAAPIQIEGQFIDIISGRPVRGLALRMENPESNDPIQAFADEDGRFRVAIPKQENPNYSLYVQDTRYRIVNPNRHVTSLSAEQVWYLLPVGSTN